MKMSYLLTLIPLLISCGDEKKESQTDTKPQVKQEAPKKEESKKEESKKEEVNAVTVNAVTVNADGVAEVVIGATDSMQYTVKEFTVKAGQKVKLTLKHTGQLPKTVMGHNLVILKPGVTAVSFATASITAKDYFPEDKADQTLAHTSLIGGGESSTIEFTAPEAGTYEYICSYPNHWVMMLGKMIVK
jgi:azurin